MDLEVGVPGSTHDGRFLRKTRLFQKAMANQGLPNKTAALDDYVEIPLVTVSNSAFPRFSWMFEASNNVTHDEKERNCKLKLKSSQIVTENVYSILKCR